MIESLLGTIVGVVTGIKIRGHHTSRLRLKALGTIVSVVTEDITPVDYD